MEKIAAYITNKSLKRELEKLLPNKNYEIEMVPYDNKFDMVHLSHDHYSDRTKDEIKKVKSDVQKHLERTYKVKVPSSTFYYTDFELK